MVLEKSYGIQRGWPLGGGQVLASGTPTPTPTPTPTGFTNNGASNTALKSMMASKSGIILENGDSTGVGCGGGITANGTTSTYLAQLTGARPYRPSNVVAGLMSAAGFPAIDAGFTGDHNCNGLLAYSLYDPRLTYNGTPWPAQGGLGHAGGNFLNANGSSVIQSFAPGFSVDRFVVIFYNTGGTFNIQIDGATPANISAPGATVGASSVTLPLTNSGFTRAVISAASAGNRVLTMSATGATPVLQSIRAYNSGVAAIDIVNHSANSASSANLAASNVGGNMWSNIEALKFLAPKLTILREGINDANQGLSTASYQANLVTQINAAKLSGDVLIVWENAANPSTFASLASQDAMHDAAAATAAAQGVAFGDIRAALGDWASTANRTADQLVHPNRGYHADIGAYIWSCIQAMAA